MNIADLSLDINNYRGPFIKEIPFSKFHILSAENHVTIFAGLNLFVEIETLYL